MKSAINKRQLDFNKSSITELNDHQLVKIYGADIVGAVKSAWVSFTQNTFNTNQAVVEATVAFSQTINQP